MTSRSPELVVIGDCNPDVLVLGDDVVPVFGQAEKLVDGISLVIGGSAAITAVAAARLGLSVALVAAVGADPAGEFMLAQLATEGVDTGAVAIRRDVPTGMTVALSHGSDRAILTATGAMTSLTAADVPESLLAAARHVHVSSYFLLERSLGPGLAGLLAAARSAGATTSLDTNWDPAELWGDSRLTAALGQVNVLLPNEAEVLRLAGRLGDSSGGPDAASTPALRPSGSYTFRGTRHARACDGPGSASFGVEVTAGVEAAGLALAARGPQLVVKLGAEGALVVDGARCWHVAAPAVTVVDTTGAGDCFNAGLIAGVLDGLALPEAATLGCAVGTMSTRAAGGTSGAPGLAEARALAGTVTISGAQTRAPHRPALASHQDSRPAVAGALWSNETGGAHGGTDTVHDRGRG